MSSRPDSAPRTRQFTTLAVTLSVVALLLFCWPLVRTPRLGLADAWAHLFGAWALLIAGLFALARGIGSSPRARERGRKRGGA